MRILRVLNIWLDDRIGDIFAALAHWEFILREKAQSKKVVEWYPESFTPRQAALTFCMHKACMLYEIGLFQAYYGNRPRHSERIPRIYAWIEKQTSRVAEKLDGEKPVDPTELVDELLKELTASEDRTWFVTAVTYVSDRPHHKYITSCIGSMCSGEFTTNERMNEVLQHLRDIPFAGTEGPSWIPYEMPEYSSPRFWQPWACPLPRLIR